MVVEGAGVAVIVGGIVVAGVPACTRRRAGEGGVYDTFRRRIGRAILLGLELLVGADIIRTVATAPTLISVAVLGGIVLIRTFLSLSLQVEVSGRWPWQHEPEPGRRPDRPSV